MKILDLDEAIGQRAVANSVCCSGHVLMKEGGHGQLYTLILSQERSIAV